MQDRGIDRPDLKLDAPGILERLSKRDLVPAQLRYAHVDGEDAFGHARGDEGALCRLQAQHLVDGPGHHGIVPHRPGDAARAVAAGSGLGAVRIEDAQGGVVTGRRGIMDGHELVEARFGSGCDGAHVRARELGRAATQVDDYDLVAEAVHFEVAAIGERTHLGNIPVSAPYIGREALCREARHPIGATKRETESQGRGLQMRARRLVCVISGVLAAALPLGVAAQTALPGSAPPATIVQPAPPSAGGAAPSAATPPPPAVATPGTTAPPGSASTTAGLPPLVAESTDPGNADEVVLPAKSVLILTGSSSWDDGLKSLRDAFTKIDAEVAKLGLAQAGRPLTVFLQTTDYDFHYDAMVPIAKAPEGALALPADMRFGMSPSGKAYRFVHKGPYSDIDATYETITAYLDAKDIVANDSFIEEYLNDVADPADPTLELNIYVQPK